VTSVTATNARKEFFDLIRRALRMREPVRIQHREGDVVLLAEEDYDSLIETLELLSIPGMRDSIAEAERDIADGHVVAAEDVLSNE
jgi:antitoxin YefM